MIGTTVWVVVVDEGDGIPGTPEVFTNEADADAAYAAGWREKWEEAYRYDPNMAVEVEAALADPDRDWPEDGGVRMWDVTLR